MERQSTRFEVVLQFVPPPDCGFRKTAGNGLDCGGVVVYLFSVRDDQHATASRSRLSLLPVVRDRRRRRVSAKGGLAAGSLSALFDGLCQSGGAGTRVGPVLRSARGAVLF